MTTGSGGISPDRLYELNIISAKSTPSWFPVTSTYPPFPSGTAQPSLSQSGSVANTKSAFFFDAYLIALSSASCSSGFGETVVGKFPSGSLCAGSVKSRAFPAEASAFGTSVMPVP
jgi:hypothetical protein